MTAPRHRRRFARSGLGALAAALLLAGCGGGGSGADVAADEPTPSTGPGPSGAPAQEAAPPSADVVRAPQPTGPVRIVYAGTTGLWSVAVDGSAPKRMDRRTSFDGLTVSPDGRTVAFAAKGLYVVGIDGTKPRLLDKTTLGDPSFSPDGRTIAMVGEAGDGLDVYAIRPDGSGRKRLTTTNAYSFGFSPTAPRVLVVNFRTLEAVDLSGGKPRALVTSPGSIFDAAWSPDGASVVYSAEPADADLSVPLDIYRVDADGSNGRPLTDTRDSTAPSWSPDGSRIVFHRGSSGGPENRGVWVMNSDGTGTKQLNTSGYRPRFTPDGRHIVYLTDSGVRAMRADGSGAKTLGNGEINYFAFARGRG